MANKPQQPKWRVGKIHAVPCPWPDCKKPNDFRTVEDYGLEPGAVLSCDFCGRKMQIKRVEATTLISVVPTQERGNLHER